MRTSSRHRRSQCASRPSVSGSERIELATVCASHMRTTRTPNTLSLLAAIDDLTTPCSRVSEREYQARRESAHESYTSVIHTLSRSPHGVGTPVLPRTGDHTPARVLVSQTSLLDSALERMYTA